MVEAKEIKLNICGREWELFFYDAFFKFTSKSSPFHSHDYAELHFTLRGECCIYTEKETLISKPGTVTFIPRGVIHRLKKMSEDTCHNAFYLKCDNKNILQKKLPLEVLEGLAEEIKQYGASGNFDKAAISIAYICKDIFTFDARLSEVENREFIIREFFAYRYSEDITLSDLAEKLQLSRKHSARLVERYMGASFSEVLTRHRICAANLLMKTDKSLTLAEIADMVGYSSYSGFWKAFHKVGSENI